MYRKYYKTENSTKEINTFEGMKKSHLAFNKTENSTKEINTFEGMKKSHLAFESKTDSN